MKIIKEYPQEKIKVYESPYNNIIFVEEDDYGLPKTHLMVSEALLLNLVGHLITNINMKHDKAVEQSHNEIAKRIMESV
jgi:hypothetical protein